MSSVHGILSLLFVVFDTLVCSAPIIIIAAAKLIVPIPAWRRLCGRLLDSITIFWIGMYSAAIDISKKVKWEVTGLEGLSAEQWYLVVANHQSWLDIVVLQKVFNRKIPVQKFFLKKELIWVPFLGICWWALDYPFMKRYSSEFLKKNPHLKGKDLEATKKACGKFAKTPVSIVNYIEGTRFTRAKHDRQKSPYKNLLIPKAGGIGYVLSAMGDRLACILDVSIVYPDSFTLWDLMCNRTKEIRVSVRRIPVTQQITGDYFNDNAYQTRFKKWLNIMWNQKDKIISKMKKR
jgi:1-acyl-sn-glycerol-3-phosphate acyltransferase